MLLSQGGAINCQNGLRAPKTLYNITIEAIKYERQIMASDGTTYDIIIFLTPSLVNLAVTMGESHPDKLENVRAIPRRISR